jgi:hypothetical protein
LTTEPYIASNVRHAGLRVIYRRTIQWEPVKLNEEDRIFFWMILDLFAIFEDATVAMSFEKYPTVSAIFSLYNFMLDHF